MSTLTSPGASIIDQYTHLDPSDFDRAIEQPWKALDQIRQTVKQSVEQGNMTPLHGVGILACASGQLFGYAAFHQQPTLVDLAAIVTNGRQHR